MRNVSIRTKYIFLSFLQQFFSGHNKFTWTKDPRTTKIIIADKYAVEMGVAAKKPSIILDRGSFGWTGSYRNEAMPLNDGVFKNAGNWDMVPKMSAEMRKNYKLTDLLRGSITFNVITKEPYDADLLANEVFYQLTGYREWFKEKGIHKMEGLSVGKESVIRVSSAEIEATIVPVSFSFTKQESVILGQRLFNGRVYKDDNEIYENIDFVFGINGTSVEIATPLKSGETLTIDYIDAITLDAIEGAELIPVSGSVTEYTIPNNGVVYGYYKVAEDILINDVTGN